MHSMSSFSSLPQARQTLGSQKIRDLINKAHDIAKAFRQKETELIQVLKILDDTKAYRATGYNSLFQFCVESLQLTEHQSYNYITVARKCTEVPELMVALEGRRITVSKARRMASVINQDNKDAWIQLAEKSSQRDLESAVRAKDPQPPVRDHLQILSQNEVKLQATLERSVETKLLRVLELLSQKSHKRVKINEALSEMCELYLEKNDPLRKAERVLKVRNKETTTTPIEPNASQNALAEDNPQESLLLEEPLAQVKISQVSSARAQLSRANSIQVLQKEGSQITQVDTNKNLKITLRRQQAHLKEKRAFIPATTKHHVWLRDRGQCRFHRQGKRCENRKYLEVHHKIPVSQGGKDTQDNLVLLCSEHHKTVHHRF